MAAAFIYFPPKFSILKIQFSISVRDFTVHSTVAEISRDRIQISIAF